MTHIHWVPRQDKLEIPNDEEEVNTREIHKCDGQEHDPDTMVGPLTPIEVIGEGFCVIFFSHFLFFPSGQETQEDKTTKGGQAYAAK